MMSRDMSGLQRGVVRFDHTPLLHMHALCIVKQTKCYERREANPYGGPHCAP